MTQKISIQQASDMPDLENVWVLDPTLEFYSTYSKPSARPRKASVARLLPKRQSQIDVSTATAKMASNKSERPRTPGTQPRQSLSYTALGGAGITLPRVPAGKRLTDSFFSCNYLSLRTLRLRSRRFFVRFVSRRVDRWPVSPPQRIAPRRLRRYRPRSRPTRSELRRSRPCAVRSISSIRISSACSTAGPRSPSQIGQIKHHQGLEVWSAAREDEVIARALAASQGPLPIETLRLIFRELMSGSRSLQRSLRVACSGTQAQLQLPRGRRKIWRGRGARPGRLDRRRLRGGQPAARAVRHRPPGELDGRTDRRHSRYVHQASQREDPCRGEAADPPLLARTLRVGPGAAGLLEVTGAVAMSQLAGKEPTTSDQGRGGLDGRRGRTRPARGVCRRGRQPFRGPGIPAQHPDREYRRPTA